MSYCVECGVKLAESEAVCPLCNTKVVNPNHTSGDLTADRPYPSNIQHQINGLNRRELAWVVMLFLLIPVGATAVIDLLTGALPFALNWSLIVIGAGAMLGVWVLVPLFFRSISPYLLLSVDFLAIAGFLAVIAVYVGSWDWCLRLGIPITLCTGLMACAVMAAIRAKRLRPLTKAALVFITLGVYIMALELIIDYAVYGILAIRWSIYAVVPLLFLSLLFFYISRKPRLMDELRRRLFV